MCRLVDRPPNATLPAGCLSLVKSSLTDPFHNRLTVHVTPGGRPSIKKVNRRSDFQGRMDQIGSMGRNVEDRVNAAYFRSLVGRGHAIWPCSVQI